MFAKKTNRITPNNNILPDHITNASIEPKYNDNIPGISDKLNMSR